MMLLIVITAPLICARISGQKVVLEFPPQLLPCSEGLRSDIDKYQITGTVGPEFSNLIASGWADKVTIQAVATFVTKICQILIGSEGEFCGKQSPTDICYCDYINVITGSAHIVAIYVAKLKHSRGIIQGILQHSNGTYHYSVNNLSLPYIFDVTDVFLEARVNDIPLVMTSDFCDVDFIPDMKNTVELCCYNSPSTCYPRISFNEYVVAENQSDCVNYSFILHNDSFVVNLTKSYSVCTLSDYITASYCLMFTVNRINSQANIYEKFGLIMSCVYILLFVIFIIVVIIQTIKGSKVPENRPYTNTIQTETINIHEMKSISWEESSKSSIEIDYEIPIGT